MYEIYADSLKNRIYLKLGRVEAGDGEKLLHDIGVETAKLVRPFTCISDIREFVMAEPGEAVWADKALKALSEAGMTRAVRVIGQDVPYSETKEKYGHIVSLARTMADAEKILADDQNLS